MFDLFVGTAWAMGGGASGGGQQSSTLVTLLPLVAMFAIFYFLLIRPQQKKAKAHKEMLANLRKGDKVVTSGGIFGVITGIDEQVVVVEIAPQVKVKVSRGNVAGVAGGNATPAPKTAAEKIEKKK